MFASGPYSVFTVWSHCTVDLYIYYICHSLYRLTLTIECVLSLSIYI
jgi:hypothetical protein